MKADRALKLLTEQELKQLSQAISTQHGMWDGGMPHVLLNCGHHNIDNYLLHIPQHWKLPTTDMLNRKGLHSRNPESSGHTECGCIFK